MHELEALAARVGEALSSRGLVLATAESCTGGWIATAVTSVSGSSNWFERGFVTYSNLAKQEMLGVDLDTLKAHGAVSEEVVREMAEGALGHSGADVSVSVSGIAGPEGGTPEKPVGTVCIGWAKRDGKTRSLRTVYSGDRELVRRQAVTTALEGILETLGARHS